MAGMAVVIAVMIASPYFVCRAVTRHLEESGEYRAVPFLFPYSVRYVKPDWLDERLKDWR